MCGCNKKKANGSSSSLRQSPTAYRLGDAVTLGLCATEKLPALFRGAYEGTDVVVHLNNSSRPFDHAINIMSPNAKVAPKIKESLVSKWPEKFCTV